MHTDQFGPRRAQRSRELDRLNLSGGFVGKIVSTVIAYDTGVDQLEMIERHLPAVPFAQSFSTEASAANAGPHSR